MGFGHGGQLQGPRRGDLMIVRYLVADTAGGGLSGSIAKKLGGSRTGPLGLVRITADLFGMSSAVQLGKEEEFTSVDAVEAKEVSKIVFQYYDGQANRRVVRQSRH